MKDERTPIEDAIDFLDQNFTGIPGIAEWAENMGYSRTTFWGKYDACFDKSPRTVFIEKKKKVLESFLKSHPDCKFREAAKVIHLSNGNDLYRFIKRHYNCTPTDLKNRILKEMHVRIYETKRRDINEIDKHLPFTLDYSD